MKCHAGVEFESGKPCPKCDAKLGEVCWPGINADLAELVELRKAVQAVVSTFEKDEAQGYRSKDRQYAITVLSAALKRS